MPHCTNDALNAALVAAQIADDAKSGQQTTEHQQTIKDLAQRALTSYRQCPSQKRVNLQNIAQRIKQLDNDANTQEVLVAALELVKAFNDVSIDLLKQSCSTPTLTTATAKSSSTIPPRIE